MDPWAGPVKKWCGSCNRGRVGASIAWVWSGGVCGVREGGWVGVLWRVGGALRKKGWLPPISFSLVPCYVFHDKNNAGKQISMPHVGSRKNIVLLELRFCLSLQLGGRAGSS